MDFVHLHSHFWGSFSDSALALDEALDRAARLGQRAMAITDHGELAFVPQFYRACLARGIHPLLGCECYFVEDARDSIARDDPFRNHLILIAANDEGYRNLVSLTSDAWLERCFRGNRGTVDWGLLERYNSGLACSSACFWGSFPLTTIRRGRVAGERELRRYLAIFGRDFHPEMANLGYEEQEISNAAILDLAPRYGLKAVVTNDVHYVHPEDWVAHDIVVKTRFGKVSDFAVGTRSIWLKGLDEMRALGFDDRHLANTAEVAAGCSARLPPFPFSPPVLHGSPEEDLRALASRCASAAAAMPPGHERRRFARRLSCEQACVGALGLAGLLLAAAEIASYFGGPPGRVRARAGGWEGSAIFRALGLSGGAPHRNPPPDAASLSRLAISCPDPEAAAGLLLGRLGPKRACRAAEFVPIRGGDALRYAAEVLGVPEKGRAGGLASVRGGDSVAGAVTRSRSCAAFCAANPLVRRWAERIEGIPRGSRPSPAALVLTNGPIRTLLPLKRLGGSVFSQYDAEGARIAGLCTVEIFPADWKRPVAAAAPVAADF
jgi:DNA polymerase-3 subunit alpha